MARNELSEEILYMRVTDKEESPVSSICSEIEQFYQVFLLDGDVKPYLEYAVEICFLWMQLFGCLKTHEDNQVFLKAVDSIGFNTTKELQEYETNSDHTINKNESDTTTNFKCISDAIFEKAFYVYIDLKMSLEMIQQKLRNPTSVNLYIRTNQIRIAKCLYLQGEYEHACLILKKVECNLPDTRSCPGNEDFYRTWIKSLVKLGKFEIAKKKLAEFKSDGKKQPYVSELDLMIHEAEAAVLLSDDSVYSDDEYVRDSNYKQMKQQKQKAKFVKEKYEKHVRKKRRRPKRRWTEDHLMTETWESVEKKIKSNAKIEDVQEDKPHKNFEIKDDKEFDEMHCQNIFENSQANDADSDSEAEDPDHENLYEQSLKMYNEKRTTEIDEHFIIQNGLKLSQNCVDKYKGSKKHDSFTYEIFKSKTDLDNLLSKYPQKYKRCIVRLESAHSAICTNADHSDQISEIEISGRSKIGKVYNEDEVCVEILKIETQPNETSTNADGKSKKKVYGKICGILKRNHFSSVEYPVFVCTIDETSHRLMIPISKIVPKLHALHRNNEKESEVGIYRYNSDEESFEHQKTIDVQQDEKQSYVFLVALICWENIYPLGAVIKVLNAKKGLSSGIEILRLQNQIPSIFTEHTVSSVQSMIENEDFCDEKNRKDLTELNVFTIDPANAKALDDALSIEKTVDGFMVGVHISDVTTWIKMNDPIDTEAKERMTTYYRGKGFFPFHMIPEPISTQKLSLLPGEKKVAISIFFEFSKDGILFSDTPKIQKSVIRSKLRLTYTETQNIIREGEPNVSKEIYQSVRDLFNITHNLRQKRLGNAMYHVPIPNWNEEENDGDFEETREAHYLVEELMILANNAIGTFLLSRFKNCVPLRVQSPPDSKSIKEWMESHKSYSHLVMKLQNFKPCPSDLPNYKFEISKNDDCPNETMLLFQRWVWRDLLCSIENKNFKDTARILGCDRLHPFACVALDEWYEHQERAEYICSSDLGSKQNQMHFSLNLNRYTSFTSPLRRYADIVVHRLVHCALDQRTPCYTENEIQMICQDINEMTNRARKFQKHCKSLILAYKLSKYPRIFYSFVKTVSEKEVVVSLPDVKDLRQQSKVLPLKLLDAVKKPIFITDNITNKTILRLSWKKVLYSFDKRTIVDVKNNDEEDGFRVNPHRKGIHKPNRNWKAMLKELISNKSQKEKLKRLRCEVNRNNNECPNELNNGFSRQIPSCYKTVDDVSSETKYGPLLGNSCEFSMTFNYLQVVALQMSAEFIKGIFVPQIELFDMTNNVKHCLLHKRDPVRYLERYSSVPSKPNYTNTADYVKTWKPIVEMEAATDAVKGNPVVINDVPVKFLSENEGKFSLGRIYCEQRNIQVYNNQHLYKSNKGNDENEEGIKEVTSSDYLCIKCSVYKPEVEQSKVRKEDLSPKDYYIWVGHAKLQRVRIRKNYMDFIFKLHALSRNVPPEIFYKEKQISVCGIEIISKSTNDQRTDAILQCLEEATPLARAIAIGHDIPVLDKVNLMEKERTNEMMHGPYLTKSNRSQTRAIKKALESSFSLIQGPPGTGKTNVGIKLVYLFCKINSELSFKDSVRKQVLFCGPSNKSVDLVAKWMKKRFQDCCPKIVRWYGSSIENQDFPVPGKVFPRIRGEHAKSDKGLREISMHVLIRKPENKYSEKIASYDRKMDTGTLDSTDINRYNKLVTKAAVEEAKKYDVIFCTTSLATNPKVIKATDGNICQIIIDECGMCTEPETMAAIIASKAKQVVLIGDHKQLRPVVKCTVAENLGLGKSLFERWAEKKSNFTMLNKQYRMNPKICDFVSKEFYSNKLKTEHSKNWCTDVPLRSWINPAVPVIFRHVEGTEDYLPFDTEEGNEKSCSNYQEVKLVVQIYQHLVDEELIESKYINIMSQYNAQCTAIRKELLNANVNTVVTSQGGEWDYVILSLVRSLPQYRIEQTPTLGWCKQNLGFITDANQTNVALTRARKGLIVVGNKNLLSCNKVWKNFLEHYAQLKCIDDNGIFPPVYHKKKRS